jgi:tRNA1Val (adenine37-N6)-methyltransferase
MNNEKKKMKYTDDHLFNEKLKCRQFRSGYRFSHDAVLLAHFIPAGKNRKILDLGAGCGIISLIIQYRWPGNFITGLEIQPELVELCNYNIKSNNYHDNIQVIKGDLANINQIIAQESFDLVISNPPYHRTGSSRHNKSTQAAIARHEISANLDKIITAIAYSLKQGGRAVCIYPAARTATLIARMKDFNLEPKRLQMVHSFPGARAKLILLEATKSGREGLEVSAPFFVHQEKGEYSKEMQQLYNLD